MLWENVHSGNINMKFYTVTRWLWSQTRVHTSQDGTAVAEMTWWMEKESPTLCTEIQEEGGRDFTDMCL
jgi:hypothetical protein